METASIPTVAVQDNVASYCLVSGSRSLLYLPHEVICTILKQLTFRDLRTIRETCKTLGMLGMYLLFRDHLVNIDLKSIEKLEKMSYHSEIALSVHSLTICPFRLFSLKDQSGEPVSNRLMADGWESLTAFHYASLRTGAKSTLSEDPTSDISSAPLLRGPYRNLSMALSKFTECKHISIKDLDGPRRTDDEYVNNMGLVTELVQSLIKSTLYAAMLSAIRMEYLSIRIGDRQVHPRFISIDMLPDLGQVYVYLRHLHISIDSKFDDPIRLQEFVRSFPNLSEFGLQVSSTVFGIRSSGVLEKLYIPELRRLSLYAVECTSTELEEFLLRHMRTLREVHLTRITIPTPDFSQISPIEFTTT